MVLPIVCFALHFLRVVIRLEEPFKVVEMMIVDVVQRVLRFGPQFIPGFLSDREANSR